MEYICGGKRLTWREVYVEIMSRLLTCDCPASP